MRRTCLALGLLAAVTVAAPAASQHPAEPGADDRRAPAAAPQRVTIGFGSFAPRRVDVVAGESVRWRNESARVHTVTADDESFGSGRLLSSDAYARRFPAVGATAYHCSLHPSMRGVVAVHELLLDAPGQAGAPRRPFDLSGRAALPAGTPVSIEADGGSGFAALASTAVGDDGRFAARIRPQATMTLRAVAAGATSPSVTLLVRDRRVTLAVRSAGRGRYRLTATVKPASRGGRLVLQTYLPERFGWWPVQKATVGKSSRATFTLRTRRRVRVRVRYTLADGATPLATSRTVRIGSSRQARGGHR